MDSRIRSRGRGHSKIRTFQSMTRCCRTQLRVFSSNNKRLQWSNMLFTREYTECVPVLLGPSWSCYSLGRPLSHRKDLLLYSMSQHWRSPDVALTGERESEALPEEKVQDRCVPPFIPYVECSFDSPTLSPCFTRKINHIPCHSRSFSNLSVSFPNLITYIKKLFKRWN